MRWAPELLIIIQLYYPWKKWNSFSHLNLPHLISILLYTRQNFSFFCYLWNKTITLQFAVFALNGWESGTRTHDPAVMAVILRFELKSFLLCLILRVKNMLHYTKPLQPHALPTELSPNIYKSLFNLLQIYNQKIKFLLLRTFFIIKYRN